MLLFHFCHLVRSMVLHFCVDLNLPMIDDIHCLLCLVSLSYYQVIYCLFQKLCRLDHGLLLLH
jgi:hypothetical protein